ncbi:MAG TPA: hypothetical protein VMW30_05720 [Candidatus Paceibacterota bacterium]|nr:hypothetical protein [Candidatus Paceibacterota bacterium]
MAPEAELLIHLYPHPPTFLQTQADLVVLASGGVEILLGVGDLYYRSLAQLSIKRSWRLTP